MSAVIYDGLSDVSTRMCNVCSYIWRSQWCKYPYV